jgi:hypothetical protein
MSAPALSWNVSVMVALPGGARRAIRGRARGALPPNDLRHVIENRVEERAREALPPNDLRHVIENRVEERTRAQEALAPNDLRHVIKARVLERKARAAMQHREETETLAERMQRWETASALAAHVHDHVLQALAAPAQA